MKSSISFLITVAVTMLLATATACAPTESPPPPATDTAAAPATASMPENTPGIVAFPTPPPATQTVALPTLTVSATSNDGRLSSTLPVVQVVSPLPSAQYSISQTVYVVAFAASDQAIGRIELSDDGVLVRTETPLTPLPTFSAVLPWTPTQTGAHALRVVAFDVNNRAGAPEEVTVTVTPDTRRPTAMIVYPLGMPQVELGSVLQVYAVATDEVGVKRMELLVDNQLYTSILAPKSSDPPSMPAIFAWTAGSAGNHTLVVRSVDTQDETTDSAALKVFVVDTHAPSIAMSLERSNVGIGEPITIGVTALDVSGIQRVELWTGKEISNTVTSANAARQTSLSTQFTWSSGNPGDYAVTVRAYNAGGNYKESPAQTISVLRPGQPTPTRPAVPTPTRTRTPRPQPTPRLQPPPPPTAEISQPSDHFIGTSPLRITFGALGNAELERVELWGYYQSQLNPQVICTIEARATTSKSGQCDWSPNEAGVVFLFAQAVDIFQQYSRSPTISGVISVPNLPTPTPTPVSLAGRWTAAVSTGQYLVVFRPVITASGTALRGDFKLTSSAAPSVETNGRVASGTVKGDRVTFRVEFTAAGTATAPTPETPSPAPTSAPTATSTPLPAAPALDFDCSVDASGNTLDCKFKDARGQNGVATFRREGS